MMVACRLVFASVFLRFAAGVQVAVHGSHAMESSITVARAAAVAQLEQEDRLVAVAAGGAWVHETSLTSVAPSSKSRGKYGFYLHTYDKPEACINLLKNVRKFYPKEPVYIMSDGGMNFSGLCNSIGNCNFQWRPPANDRWNPLPFFNRMREAAQWLDTVYLIMLEPDNEIQGKIAHDPSDDAGGLRDSNPPFGKPLLEFLQQQGQKRTGKANFTVGWNRFGLAGGSYFRTSAILAAFDPLDSDWQSLRQWCGKKIWSSDVAMPMALASHGFSYKPWEEVTQTRSEDFWGKPANHPAFRHYGRDEIKPHYADRGMSLADQALVTRIPAWAGSVACQGCVWVDDKECWRQKPVSCPIRSHDGGPPWSGVMSKVTRA